MTVSLLYINNDAFLALTNLADRDGNTISDATVTATLFGKSRVEVGGQSWPLTFSIISGVPGKYEALLDKAVILVAGTKYDLRITVVSGTSDGEFWREILVEEQFI
ncbi:hypothetical protein LCGC14_1061370 [marine sediment metagenome]|uniref:Uncharacterized protein n=1 Tax=marine sediment metagenome TaxID=412755 RepID=A0A0F9ML27_9ZZZZ